MRSLITVKAARDPEAQVWFVESSDVPGLAAEADTFEALVDKLPSMIADLIEENGFDGSHDAADVPVEIIAHASSKIRLASAA